MLEKLHDKFEDERTDLEKEESNARHAYEMLIQVRGVCVLLCNVFWYSLILRLRHYQSRGFLRQSSLVWNVDNFRVKLGWKLDPKTWTLV